MVALPDTVNVPAETVLDITKLPPVTLPVTVTLVSVPTDVTLG